MKLDRLGSDLRHRVNTAQDWAERGIGLKALSGQGAQIDTITARGKLVFGIFAMLAELERELMRERTKAGSPRHGLSTKRRAQARPDRGPG